MDRIGVKSRGQNWAMDGIRLVYFTHSGPKKIDSIQLLYKGEVVYSKCNHLRVGWHFSWFFVDKATFSSFSRERKIDVGCNTIGFIFFESLLTYL